MSDGDPILTPKPISIFSEWCVEVRWPDGFKETVSAFRSEAHARGWIEQESRGWIAARRRR